MTPLTRLLIEAGPLAAFFVTNAQAGIMAGTGVFMLATTVSLLFAWKLERRIPVMPLVGCFFVLLFGGLTLWLDDELFIKLKPTVVNLLFATALFAGLATRRNLLKPIFSGVFSLDEEGWRKLALRWACFFVLLAGLNEVVWRTMTTDAWVNFKVFGIMPLTLLFSALQMPMITRHQKAAEESGAGAE